jgi:hypothetical protein
MRHHCGRSAPAFLLVVSIAELRHGTAFKTDFTPVRSGPDARPINISLGQRSEGAPVQFLHRLHREANMTVRLFAIVPAMVLALGAATALAQPSADPLMHLDQASATVVNAAYIGDGTGPCYQQNHQELLNEPGYSVGTGAAQVCGAPATVGQRSDPSSRLSKKAPPREPGYSVGTGAALVSGA